MLMPTPAFRPRPASAAIRPVFLVALCLAVCFAADPAFARSSIGPSADVAARISGAILP